MTAAGDRIGANVAPQIVEDAGEKVRAESAPRAVALRPLGASLPYE